MLLLLLWFHPLPIHLWFALCDPNVPYVMSLGLQFVVPSYLHMLCFLISGSHSGRSPMPKAPLISFSWDWIFLHQRYACEDRMHRTPRSILLGQAMSNFERSYIIDRHI